ncbi:UNVERIFIED_CONTAM: chtl-1 [Trichonephila clavipes]
MPDRVAACIAAGDKHKLSSPIWRSLRILICYHLGSIAFGSLIIAIMKAIRALFRLLQKYMDDQNQRCNTFWKIFQCCLACFESYLKFLSKNAYIMIEINYQNDMNPEIRKRIVAANLCFFGLRSLLQSHLIKRKTKIMLYKILIKSVLTYATETCTLTKIEDKI